MHETSAAAISSATHPSPPSNDCNFEIPSGFFMSKNLKSPKPSSNPNALYGSAESGRKQKFIATNSSRMIFPGSRMPMARSAASQMPTAR